MTARRTPSMTGAGLPAATPRSLPTARKPLVATAAVLITLLIGLLPSSAALAPAAGTVLGQATHHHLTVPGIVRAEIVAPVPHSDATLWTAALAGLTLLGWLFFRPARTAIRPVPLPVPVGRDPPPTR